MNEMIRIAFYGKGGIGKSTVAADVSYCLSRMGLKVLHIGCDPKSDSTRSLMKRKIPTVLDMINDKGQQLKREDIVHESPYGISCIEAGGPKAGIGCAGVGITASQDALEKTGILKENWDAIIYDVLGDVVCGGFAVPMKKHFVDRVYVVTSTAYMSFYAANNILRCVENCCRDGYRMAGGLVINHVLGEEDLKLAGIFSDQIGVGICGYINESVEIKKADYMKTPVSEFAPDCEASMRLYEIAERIYQQREGWIPDPMSDDEMESLGEKILRTETGEK